MNRSAQAGWEGRHISGTATHALLSEVRACGGARAVARVVEAACDTRSIDVLENPESWSSYDQAVSLFEAAAGTLGDPEVGRRAGERVLRSHSGTPVEHLLRSLGGPGEVLRNIAATSAKFNTVVDTHATEITEDRAVIRSRTRPGFRRHPLLCDYAMGLLSQVPALFGRPPARVEHDECEVRGAPECVYRISWAVGAEPADPGARDLGPEVMLLKAQLRALQATTADLISPFGLEAVLARVCRGAARAVQAPAFVLAVRGSGHDEPLVAAEGLAPAEARRVGRGLLASDPIFPPHFLVVDVKASDRWYGRLAALVPEGGAFLPAERSLLDTFAGLAAAAIGTSQALDAEREERRTTTALLELALNLAAAQSLDDVCRHLAAALPTVAGADRACAYRWQAEPGELRLAAHHGFAPQAVPHLGRRVQGDAADELLSMRDKPLPRFVGLDTDDRCMRDARAASDARSVAIVPLLAHEEFLGLVIAEWAMGSIREMRRDPEAAARLTAVANQAATAMENILLVEQMRDQCLHDPLTGLANVRQLEERFAALAADAHRRGEQVSVLYLDLEGFKAVNDRLGHAAGDEVLRQIAQRLRASVRPSDLVARVGGDEFVVLLVGLGDGDAADAGCTRLTRSLKSPLSTPGGPVTVDVSVGRATWPDDGQLLSELLELADAAMYRDKRRTKG